jgi:asparagine synthase (glutamine-hydrolysing)
MCGITGYSGIGDETILKKMNVTLHHRGPDDSGTEIFHAKNGAKTSTENNPSSTGLAMCRLAIMDLSPAGHQPMQNKDKTVSIVFNGEIYNFQELKNELINRYSFKGHSDTEVILHLYESIGTEVFSKIQGMFAIAIYDERKGQLILARDRMGKKPLFWGVHEETLLFGSELKALIAHPSFKKEIDLESLNKYLLYEYVPTPHTIFKNTWKLEAGTFLIWNGKQVQKTVFWKPTFLPKKNSFSDAKYDLGQSLESAVKDRLVADVPVGIFLSGGIDSSAVAYYAAKNNPGKVKTFSIGFKETSFDESTYARQVAKQLGTEHYEKILSISECLSIIPDIAKSLDEPMADASIVPTYLLSKFTREHVTVALGGDGGDELFAGYDTFLAHRFASLYGLIPEIIRDGFIKKLVNLLPSSGSNMSFDFRIKKFVNGFEKNMFKRNQRWLGAFDRSERQSLLSREVWNEVKESDEFNDISRYLNECDSGGSYDKLAYIYERMYMMDQVLVKVDRASMMNSLEVRAPFLDTRVVDLANHMPSDFKFKGLTRKYILKKLMEGKLPKEIIYRKKKGFGIPIAEWLRGDLKPLVLDYLGPESIRTMGLFDAQSIEKLLKDHFAGTHDNRKQIWTLLIFAMWYRRWMK